MLKNQNLATLQSFEVSKNSPLCETCNASLVFHLMSPSNTHKIDLLTILNCLELAQNNQAIPILDLKWWNRIRSEHG